MKNLQITLEKAVSIYAKGDDIMNELLLQTFTIDELEKPKKRAFSDINHRGYDTRWDGSIGKTEARIGLENCMTDFPTKEMALAVSAMAELAWWMRQPEYNGEDQGDWCDWDSSDIKTVIYIDRNTYKTRCALGHRRFLSFKTKEIADGFLKDRRGVIERARPLLG